VKINRKEKGKTVVTVAKTMVTVANRRPKPLLDVI
jgi:hypothetical protein